jgi:hypothetical protein
MTANLPDALLDLFGEDAATGQWIACLYSVTDAREIERTLAEHGVSYQTQIIRSRRKGTYYRITLLESVYA